MVSMDANETFLRVVVPKVLRKTADILEKGGQPCELTEDEARVSYKTLAEGLNNKPMSQETASAELGVSPSTFRNLIRAGRIPPGKKVRGFKELRWYRADLKRYLKKIAK